LFLLLGLKQSFPATTKFGETCSRGYGPALKQ